MVQDKDTCEVCGKHSAQFVAVIEGATLRVCGTCARSGKIIEHLGHPRGTNEQSQYTQTYKRKVRMVDDIMEDYSTKIRRKRQELRLPVSVIAERVNEKESYLHGVENNSIKPSITTAKKLEKLLGLELIEKVEAESSRIPTAKKNLKKKDEPTLGDYLSK